MEWQDIEVNGRHTVKFADLPYVPLSPSISADDNDLFIGKKLGGILRHGEWGWLARNSVLQIVSLRNGQTISNYEFCESRGYESCCIKCVEEIFPNSPVVMLLAVILESFRGPGGGSSYVAVYSVDLGTVLNSIELSLHLTCARFMAGSACRRSLLQNFDGCLAVGSEEGVVVLLDLNLRKLTSMHNEMHEDIFVPCHIVDYSLPLTEIHRNFRQCQQDGVHFGLQMEVIESPCSIQCILPIDLILGVAIGLEDGRLALYDLAELQIFYVALPSPAVTMSALVKMDFLEPPDDPRPCLFIWALHENGENLHAILHSLMYEKRLMEEDDSITYFESFQTCSVRLQLPLEATKSTALACQAISNLSTHGEDDSNCLCVISWLSVLEGKNKLLIFDLNQWYKEEMPFLLEYGKQPSYLAGYILNGECTGLQALINPNSIAHFNSMQRFEEHFYPNSLSFEGLLLHTEGCRCYNWEGAQNRVINLLRLSNASIFLEPNIYFNEILRTRLLPQFIDLNINSTFSRSAKYEILLSSALEHNCVSLLRDCAKSWIDGSFMGNFTAATGLSLSTLTEWIWKRATCIKSRCNDLCKSLFEFGGYPLDSREQKELSFITRQLKLLTDLLKEVLVYAKKQIPERVFSDLENKQNSLSMATSYQDILLWLLNIGLLPEGSAHNDKINASHDLIPYPYSELKEFYKNKRLFFAKINESFISKKSGSCKLLFIDSFIEHVCKGNILHEYWLENEGNGLYPPNSLEAMLRVMLVPDLDYDSKCAILLYFFLDLNMAIDEEVYKDVVANFIKFPSVFKLSAPLIKTVQAFWNLDHDHYVSAVDEFISPFNKNQCYPQWQVELLIEVLLNQKASNLALRILESQPSLISPLLKLNTLLANELVSEAFHFVRSKNEDSLLETFFTRCLCNGHFGVIRDLALSEREGLILQSILKKSKAPGAESLHFVYLLQKSKYIEAVSYMEDLSNKAKGIKSSLYHSSEMDTPNLVLSAFNTTMAPVTQGLTDVYFRIKNKIKKKEVDNKSPVPLSCQLIKQNANSLLGGIYHSSALSAHFATYYWGEMEEKTKHTKHILNSNNAPFLRRPQIDTNCLNYLAKNNISYPQAYKVTEKRSLVESEMLDNEQDEFERHKIEHKLNPKKKRRLRGQQIVDDLTQFMKMKTSKSLNASEFTFGPEQLREPVEQTNNEAFDLLTRPLMKKTNKRDKEMEEVGTLEPEIHSILKTHTPELGHQQRELLVEEEKNLRFRLPSTENNATQPLMALKKNKDSVDDIIEDKQDVEIRKPSTLAESSNFKRLARAVSEESLNSSVCSSKKSEENFYSPLSSQNNSKLDISNLSRCSILSGPQPRKPLSRLSIERSEKSLTPEPKTKTTDPSSINKSSSLYTTALEASVKSKISSRKSLEQLDSNDLEVAIKTDDFVGNESAYNTALETVSKTIAVSSTKLKEEVTYTTSGFGSIGSHCTFAGSKIDEFLPKGSSSKVGSMPVKTIENKTSSQQEKLSECSTVLGSLTTFESHVFSMPSVSINKTKPFPDHNNPTEEQKRQMLETTLSMSTYDISGLETTSLQQTESSLMVTAEAVTLHFEVKKENENKRIELEETQKMEYEQQLEEIKEENKNPIDVQNQTGSLEQMEESKGDCIVLLSSSSSSPSLSEGNNYAINYDEEEEDENDGEEEVEEYEMYSEDDDMSNEDMEDDYDEEFNNEELVMEESAEFVHLIEDSSSDVRQQQTFYYGENNSDDVKVIENKQVLEEADNNDLTVPNEEKSKKEISTSIVIEPKAVTEEFKPIKESNVTNNTSITHNKSIPLQANKAEENYSENAEKLKSTSLESNSAEKVPSEDDNSKNVSITVTSSEIESDLITEKKSDELKINKNKTSDVTDEERKNVINIEKRDVNEVTKENTSEEFKVNDTKWSGRDDEERKDVTKKEETDITEVIIEMKSKDLEQNDTSTSVAEQEKKQEQEYTESGSTDVTSTKTVEISFEENKSQQTTSKENTENNNIVEASEKKPICLRMEETIEDSKLKLEIKSAVIEKIEKKTNVIMETETISKDLANKETIKVQEIKSDSSEIQYGSPLPYAKIEQIDNKEVQKIKDDSPLLLAKHEKIENIEVLKVLETEGSSAVMFANLKRGTTDTKSASKEKATEKMDEKDAINVKKEKNELTVKEIEKEINIATILTPSKHKTLKGSSVLPMLSEPNVAADVSTPRRNARSTSVPPQAITETEEISNVTPCTRHSIRASSLQPKFKEEDNDTGTPRKVRKTHEIEFPKKRATRGSSLPPGKVEDKISTRRRSVLLDAVNEDPNTLDSPSTRTRLRSRLNSMDSEVDSPVVSAKRTRKMSISNNSNENLLTPKRTRRDSVASHSETSASVGTPRTLRSKSVLSVQEEDTKSIPASPKLTNKKGIELKPTNSNNDKEQIEQISPKSDQSLMSEASYSSSRRLTRTQLAIMEKSADLSQAMAKAAAAKEADPISLSQNKRATKARSTRSSNVNADSDDAESVSSKLSTTSSITGTKRRVTRSSNKEKDDVEDDGVSVASSLGSERQQKTRLSKDKSSPSATLTTIPEDAPVETKKRGRPTKH